MASPGSSVTRWMPSCGKSSWPSKTQYAPRPSAARQRASRALSTNQPSSTGTRPVSVSARRASVTIGAEAKGWRASDVPSVRGRHRPEGQPVAGVILHGELALAPGALGERIDDAHACALHPRVEALEIALLQVQRIGRPRAEPLADGGVVLVAVEVGRRLEHEPGVTAHERRVALA